MVLSAYLPLSQDILLTLALLVSQRDIEILRSGLNREYRARLARSGSVFLQVLEMRVLGSSKRYLFRHFCQAYVDVKQLLAIPYNKRIPLDSERAADRLASYTKAMVVAPERHKRMEELADRIKHFFLYSSLTAHKKYAILLGHRPRRLFDHLAQTKLGYYRLSKITRWAIAHSRRVLRASIIDVPDLTILWSEWA